MTRLTLACLFAVPTLAFAQDIDTSVDFTKLDRDEFVQEARQLGEASWVGAMAIFARIDPSIAEKVPDFPWSDAFADAYGCVYEDMSGNGTLSQYNDMRDEGVRFMAFLDENPEVTLLNIDQYDEALDLMTPSDDAIKAMQTCGLMDLNQQAMLDSGLMQAVTSFYAAQGE